VIDHADRTWWRQAVVYQVYIRSFAGFPPPDTAIWLGR
jgi:hypothetical protein